MTNTKPTNQSNADLQDPGDLKTLFPRASKAEITSISKLSSRIVTLREFATLSKESTAKILATIKTEWREEFERSRAKVARNILEKIQHVYNREGIKGLNLRPLLIPVGLSTLLLIFSFVPEFTIPFNNVAGETLNNLSGPATDNMLFLGGIVATVAVGFWLVLRNSKE